MGSTASSNQDRGEVGSSSKKAHKKKKKTRNTVGSRAESASESTSESESQSSVSLAKEGTAMERGKGNVTLPQTPIWEVWNELDEKEDRDCLVTVRKSVQIKARALERRGTLTDKPPESTHKSPFTLSSNKDQLLSQLGSINLQLTPRAERWRNVAQEESSFSLTPGQALRLNDVTALMDDLNKDMVMEKSSLFELLQRATKYLDALPNITDLDIPKGGRVTIVGDLHGQYNDLLTILRLNGLPSEQNVYVFNGDWVDRGNKQTEVMISLFALLLACPGAVHLNRGNHESAEMNELGGFKDECLFKYQWGVYNAFNHVFAFLPVATVVAKRVFVVHGGLFSRDVTLAEINAIDRKHQILPPRSLVSDMLWSDPKNIDGWAKSKRGEGVYFGKDVCRRFLLNNRLQMVVRSHQCVPEGFQEWWDGTLVTVFSATNYRHSASNRGAFMIIDERLHPSYVQFGGWGALGEADEMLASERINLTQSVLAHDVARKLYSMICRERLRLVEEFTDISSSRETDPDQLGPDVITREEWARGLCEVLAVDVPFLEFTSHLGLPVLGTRGQEGGPINFVAWLQPFKPKNVDERLMMTTPEVHGRSIDNVLQELLMHHGYELRTMFDGFDTQQTGRISPQDMEHGLMTLCEEMKVCVSKARLEAYASQVQTCDDGMIDYDRFLARFAPALKATEAQAGDFADKAMGTQGQQLKETLAASQKKETAPSTLPEFY